jgi:hypothetical protein
MRARLTFCTAGGLLILSGCAATLTQLERMKHGDARSNAVESISCAAGQQECYQLHLLKGDACYKLAVDLQEERQLQQSPPPQTRDRLRQLDSCAADELHAGTTLAGAEHTPVGEIREYALKRLEALRDLIDTRESGDPSGADVLAQAASEFGKRYPGDPAGPYYLASARLAAAQDNFLRSSDPGSLCAALPDIERLVSTGSASPGGLEAQYTNLAASLAVLKRTGGCT